MTGLYSFTLDALCLEIADRPGGTRAVLKWMDTQDLLDSLQDRGVPVELLEPLQRWAATPTVTAYHLERWRAWAQEVLR